MSEKYPGYLEKETTGLGLEKYLPFNELETTIPENRYDTINENVAEEDENEDENDMFVQPVMEEEQGIQNMETLYASLGLQSRGLPVDTFKIALNGYGKLLAEGQIKNKDVLTIIDFNQSSRLKRMYVLDLKSRKVAFQCKVAHGKNSVKPGDSKEKAGSFSNIMGSNKSSLGFYITLTTYEGKHGYSLKLKGIEEEFNSNALSRKVVVHGASYVHEDDDSPAGLSWGCPAIDMKLKTAVINTIKDGTCFFIFFNDREYLERSGYALKVQSYNFSNLFSTLKNIGSSIYSGVTSQKDNEDEEEELEQTDKEWKEENSEEEMILESENEDARVAMERFMENENLASVSETLPSLLSEDLTVPDYTCYVKIVIGTGNYILNKTGIYIPSGFDPSKPVIAILYLHGMTNAFPGQDAQIDKYWKANMLPGYDFRLREEVNKAGKNVILIAPSLGNFPNNYKNILANKNGGLDQYMNQVLLAVNKYIISNRYHAPAVNIDSLILAVHSAGGSQMRRIVSLNNSFYSPLIKECWGFDCLYGKNDVPLSWINWAKDNRDKKLYIYYLDGTKRNSEYLMKTQDQFPNIHVEKSTAKNHFLVPKEHLKQRIMNIGN